MKKPFVIFDRDGTLIEHVHYLSEPDGVVPKKNSFEGLLLLRNLGFNFGIITNQSIINRGIATKEQVELVNSRVKELFENRGLSFEFILLCPHTPEDDCSCRKPAIGLGTLAEASFGLDPKRSFMIGDQVSDVIFGKTLGYSTIQVGDIMNSTPLADYFASDILEAAKWIRDLEKTDD